MQTKVSVSDEPEIVPMRVRERVEELREILNEKGKISSLCDEELHGLKLDTPNESHTKSRGRH